MSDSPVWFQKGLPFKCTGCGKCCTGTPGYVWVTEEEIANISSYLGLSKETFMKKYVRTTGDRYALLERPNLERRKEFDCVFLKDKQCQVYPVRPKQCQTFPWWPENVSSKEAWEEVGEYCEGINHPEAAVIPYSEIQKGLENSN